MTAQEELLERLMAATAAAQQQQEVNAAYINRIPELMAAGKYQPPPATAAPAPEAEPASLADKVGGELLGGLQGSTGAMLSGAGTLAGKLGLADPNADWGASLKEAQKAQPGFDGLTGDVLAGIGSSVPFLATSAAGFLAAPFTGGSSIPAALSLGAAGVMGGLQHMDEQVERRQRLDPSLSRSEAATPGAMAAAALMGGTEILPIGSGLQRAAGVVPKLGIERLIKNKKVAEAARGVVGQTLTEGTEEALQEFGTTLGHQVVAGQDIDMGEAAHGGLVGGIVGSALGGVQGGGSALRKAHQEKKAKALGETDGESEGLKSTNQAIHEKATGETKSMLGEIERVLDEHGETDLVDEVSEAANDVKDLSDDADANDAEEGERLLIDSTSNPDNAAAARDPFERQRDQPDSPLSPESEEARLDRERFEAARELVGDKYAERLAAALKDAEEAESAEGRSAAADRIHEIHAEAENESHSGQTIAGVSVKGQKGIVHGATGQTAADNAAVKQRQAAQPQKTEEVEDAAAAGPTPAKSAKAPQAAEGEQGQTLEGLNEEFKNLPGKYPTRPQKHSGPMTPAEVEIINNWVKRNGETDQVNRVGEGFQRPPTNKERQIINRRMHYMRGKERKRLKALIDSHKEQEQAQAPAPDTPVNMEGESVADPNAEPESDPGEVQYSTEFGVRSEWTSDTTIKDRVNEIFRTMFPQVQGVYFADVLTGSGPALAVSQQAAGQKVTESAEVAGMVDRAKALVWISLNRKFNATQAAFHEAYHLVRQYMTEPEIKILEDRFGPMNEEAEAIAFSERAMGESGAVRKVMDRIWSFFEQLGNALRGRGFNSVDSIFDAAQSGKVAARTKMTQQAEKGVLYSAPNVDPWVNEDKAEPREANASWQPVKGVRVPTNLDPGLKQYMYNIINQVAPDAKVQFVEDIKNLDPKAMAASQRGGELSGERTSGADSTAAGVTERNWNLMRATITVSMEAVDAGTNNFDGRLAAHEAYHAAYMYLNNEEKQILKNHFDKHGQLSRSELEEAQAYTFERYMFDNVMPDAPKQVQNIFIKLKEFFTKLGNYLKGIGFNNIAQIEGAKKRASRVFDKVASGEVGRRPLDAMSLDSEAPTKAVMRAKEEGSGTKPSTRTKVDADVDPYEMDPEKRPPDWEPPIDGPIAVDKEGNRKRVAGTGIKGAKLEPEDVREMRVMRHDKGLNPDRNPEVNMRKIRKLASRMMYNDKTLKNIALMSKALPEGKLTAAVWAWRTLAYEARQVVKTTAQQLLDKPGDETAMLAFDDALNLSNDITLKADAISSEIGRALQQFRHPIAPGGAGRIKNLDDKLAVLNKGGKLPDQTIGGQKVTPKDILAAIDGMMDADTLRGFKSDGTLDTKSLLALIRALRKSEMDSITAKWKNKGRSLSKQLKELINQINRLNAKEQGKKGAEGSGHLKGTLLDKLYFLYYNSILSSPTTQARNAIGGAFMYAVMSPIEESITAGIESAKNLVKDRSLESAKKPWRAYGKAMSPREALTNDLRDASKNFWEVWTTGELTDGVTFDDANVMVDATKVFEPGSRLAILRGSLFRPKDGEKRGIAEFTPGRMLAAVDEFWKMMAGRRAMRGMAERLADKMDTPGEKRQEFIDEFIRKSPDWAKISARNYARYLTMTTELEGVGQKIAELRSQNFPLTMVLPIVRPVWNMIRFGARRIPVIGLLPTLSKNGWTLGTRWANSPRAKMRVLTEQVTGAALLAAVGQGVANGWITGPGPSDDQERLAWLQVYQPYSILVGGRWWRYDDYWDIPGLAIGAIASAYESAGWGTPTGVDPEQPFSDKAIQFSTRVATGLGQAVLNKSMLQNFNRLAQSWTDPDRMPAFTSSMLTQPVPGLVKWMARRTQDHIPRARDWRQNIERSLPWTVNAVPPVRDIYGEPLKMTKALGMSIWHEPKTPFKGEPTTDRERRERFLTEFQRLGMGVSAPRKKILGGVKLKPEEYDDYWVWRGNNLWTAHSTVMSNPGFWEMTDPMKREMIRKAQGIVMSAASDQAFAVAQKNKGNPRLLNEYIRLRRQLGETVIPGKAHD